MVKRGPEGRALPLEWLVDEDTPCRYATNLVVQHTEHEFTISFFRASPPILLGSVDEIKEQLKNVQSIPAQCVARVVVAGSRMPEFVQVLQDNLETYLANQESEEE